MKYLLPAILLLSSFGCGKNSENLLERPEYKTMTANTWLSDSVHSRASGTTTVSYSTPGNYELLHFYALRCGFIRYAGGRIADSVAYTAFYEPGRLFLSADTATSGLVYNSSNIRLATDTLLILEHHTSPDSSVAVVTTYYHAQ